MLEDELLRTFFSHSARHRFVTASDNPKRFTSPFCWFGLLRAFCRTRRIPWRRHESTFSIRRLYPRKLCVLGTVPFSFRKINDVFDSVRTRLDRNDIIITIKFNRQNLTRKVRRENAWLFELIGSVGGGGLFFFHVCVYIMIVLYVWLLINRFAFSFGRSTRLMSTTLFCDRQKCVLNESPSKNVFEFKTNNKKIPDERAIHIIRRFEELRFQIVRNICG